MTSAPDTSEPAPKETPRRAVSIAVRAIGMLGLLTLITGVAYPLAITAVAQALFSDEANGSLVVSSGEVRGSSLIGQHFEDPKYFWGRLSATTEMPYDAAASKGSNLGPRNEARARNARARVDALHAADPGNSAPIPVDLVTSSGSGLDPHISPAAARYQRPRVARARGLPEARVQALVHAHTTARTLGILGEPRVNVLLLNLALDREEREGVEGPRVKGSREMQSGSLFFPRPLGPSLLPNVYGSSTNRGPIVSQ